MCVNFIDTELLKIIRINIYVQDFLKMDFFCTTGFLTKRNLTILCGVSVELYKYILTHCHLWMVIPRKALLVALFVSWMN